MDIREKKDLDMLSIEARQTSFEEDNNFNVPLSTSSPSSTPPDEEGRWWKGPSGRKMARGGFCRVSSSKSLLSDRSTL